MKRLHPSGPEMEQPATNGEREIEFRSDSHYLLPLYFLPSFSHAVTLRGELPLRNHPQTTSAPRGRGLAQRQR